MNELTKIIGYRGTPGILVFDLGGQLVFANHIAVEMQLVLSGGGTGGVVACDKITSLCCYLTGPSRPEELTEKEEVEYQILAGPGRPSYSVRPFLIGDEDNGKLDTSILILVEKIVKRHEINLDKSRREFFLTKREAQIAALLCKGCSNREISELLFISEFTVKNHVKRIIHKTGATSRSQIFTLLQ